MWLSFENFVPIKINKIRNNPKIHAKFDRIENSIFFVCKKTEFNLMLGEIKAKKKLFLEYEKERLKDLNIFKGIVDILQYFGNYYNEL